MSTKWVWATFRRDSVSSLVLARGVVDSAAGGCCRRTLPEDL
jgi:hypothetical protein